MCLIQRADSGAMRLTHRRAGKVRFQVDVVPIIGGHDASPMAWAVVVTDRSGLILRRPSADVAVVTDHLDAFDIASRAYVSMKTVDQFVVNYHRMRAGRRRQKRKEA
jgi:hypothetical protein